AVISLGRAFTKLNPPPKRTLLFLATTAEEAGLLGAKYYATHPLYPLGKTLADINIDSMNVWGKARDIEDTSFGMSSLDDALARSRTIKCSAPSAKKAPSGTKCRNGNPATSLSQNAMR